MNSLPALKHYASVVMGQSPPSNTYNLDGEGLPFLQGNAEFGALSPSPKHFCPVPPKAAESGDVLLSVRAPVGALNLADQPYGIGRGLCAVRAANNRASPKFLYYLLSHLRPELSSVATGSTYDAVSWEDVAALRFDFPPLPTQKAIADYLDEKTAAIDALIEKKRKLLDLLAEERAALINQAVTKGLDPSVPMKDSGIPWIGGIPAHWEVRPSRYLVDSARPIMYGIVLPGHHVEDGIPIVKANNCRPGRLRLDLMKRTSREIESRYARSRLLPGDVVIAIRGSVGSAEIVPDELKGANLTQDAARLAPGAKLRSQWLRYLTLSEWFRGFIEPRITGATVKGLNIWDLARVPLPDVSLSEQRDIEEQLNQRLRPQDSVITSTEKSVARLEEYRQALITAAVTGQLDIEAAA